MSIDFIFSFLNKNYLLFKTTCFFTLETWSVYASCMQMLFTPDTRSVYASGMQMLFNIETRSVYTSGMQMLFTPETRSVYASGMQMLFTGPSNFTLAQFLYKYKNKPYFSLVHGCIARIALIQFKYNCRYNINILNRNKVYKNKNLPK